jgi:hypothetical protein
LGLWLNRIRRGFNRPPEELRRRLVQEAMTLLDRFRVSPTYGLDDGYFVNWFGVKNIEDLWLQLSSRPFPSVIGQVRPAELDSIMPGETVRIIENANRAVALEVNLLGSGPETLSSPIPWNTDFKVKEDWPQKFFRDIDILNPKRASDVKVPWELSRLQWLIPVGQAYMLTGDNKYAEFTRDILTDWMEANPYARGVNWAVGMEVAMRIFTWTWLFHVFKGSVAWNNYDFRSSFLRCLFEHAVFCERYIEDYGVNGNHCTADAGALVFAGLFFGVGKKPKRWQEVGWNILLKEMPRQVYEDGVDFEGSIAYHRFVAEMFFWPAKYRQACSESIPSSYHKRLLLMAEFTRSYSKPDGLAPLWGDADDGRVLPFGGQHLNDHSYIPDLIEYELKVEESGFASLKASAEYFWTYGCKSSPAINSEGAISKCFESSGFYVMASGNDHVFIDCGAIGFGGKGGHGHNDCLSFEASLDGVSLITDSGTYVYTASYEQRNIFRGTASHNTPMIDGQEQNRFISDAELFALRDDAEPKVQLWETNSEFDKFVGTHSGYHRLDQPVTVIRSIILEKAQHRLRIKDQFEGDGAHTVVVPLHLAPSCEIKEIASGIWALNSHGREFFLVSDGWISLIREGWVSPSYGVKEKAWIIEFSHGGPLKNLTLGIYLAEQAPNDPKAWLESFS